jgi:hypothetical protein
MLQELHFSFNSVLSPHENFQCGKVKKLLEDEKLIRVPMSDLRSQLTCV